MQSAPLVILVVAFLAWTYWSSSNSNFLNSPSATDIAPSVSVLRNSTIGVKPGRPSTISKPKAVIPQAPRRFENASVIPTKHPLDNIYYKRAVDHINRYKRASTLVFLGDNVLNRLCRNETIFKPFEVKFGAINLASPSFRTENVLQHIKQGLIKNFTNSPTFVLMVGSSNLVAGDSVNSITQGVAAVVKRIKAEQPKSNVILLGLLPRTPHRFNRVVQSTNNQLALMFQNSKNNTTGVKYLNFADKFMDKNMTVKKSLYLSDMTHPSAAGVEVIMANLAPLLSSIRSLPSLARTATNLINGTTISPIVVTKKPVNTIKTSINRTATPVAKPPKKSPMKVSDGDGDPSMPTIKDGRGHKKHPVRRPQNNDAN